MTDPVAEARRAIWDEVENFGSLEGMFYCARSPARLKALAEETLASQLKIEALIEDYAKEKALAVVDEYETSKGCGCSRPWFGYLCVHYGGRLVCRKALRDRLEKEAARD